MRDLKYLYEFENLLQEANNALVQAEKVSGGIALGYTCYHIPEVLLNCGNCFSVRRNIIHGWNLPITRRSSLFLRMRTRSLITAISPVF